MSDLRALVAVATDRSPGGTQAVECAAAYARSLGGDGFTIQVVAATRWLDGD